MTNSIDPNPKVWGPKLWKKLHKITFDYPETINPNNPNDVRLKNRVKKLFIELRTGIPCKDCRKSYRLFTKRYPIDRHLDSRGALSRWFYNIHNMVNAKLRKRELSIFRTKMQELDDYSRIYRISPEQFNRYKTVMKSKIMITGPDPTYQHIKNRYT